MGKGKRILARMEAEDSDRQLPELSSWLRVVPVEK